jgi:prolipoprotein diacylglyceryltransferase
MGHAVKSWTFSVVCFEFAVAFILPQGWTLAQKEMAFVAVFAFFMAVFLTVRKFCRAEDSQDKNKISSPAKSGYRIGAGIGFIVGLWIWIANPFFHHGNWYDLITLGLALVGALIGKMIAKPLYNKKDRLKS